MKVAVFYDCNPLFFITMIPYFFYDLLFFMTTIPCFHCHVMDNVLQWGAGSIFFFFNEINPIGVIILIFITTALMTVDSNYENVVAGSIPHCDRHNFHVTSAISSLLANNDMEGMKELFKMEVIAFDFT